MKDQEDIIKTRRGDHMAATADRMAANDKEPTQRAEAKKANQLPPGKQLSEFDQQLQHDDPGNQPS